MSKLRFKKQQKTRTPEEKALHAKFNAAVLENYKKHGVGRTIAQRLAFWESQHPDGYSMSHDPDDRTKVAVFETSYLADVFPADFPRC